MRNSTVRTFRRHCLASLALLTVGFALAPTQPAAADERGVELDPDGLEPIYEVNPIRFYDPWLIEAMGRIDEVLDADLPPLDLGSSLGVIDSCAGLLALLETGAPPDHTIWHERYNEPYPLTTYIMGKTGGLVSPEQQERYLSKFYRIDRYYNECADARLLQMAGPVTVSYFNEKFPAADIYRNYTLRMPGSWTKLLSEWEYDEVVVLSDRLKLHFYDDWYHSMTIQALGDFTGDGVLDLLVYENQTAIKGTYRFSGLAIFVRTEEGGPVKRRSVEDVLFARLHPGWEHPDWAEE